MSTLPILLLAIGLLGLAYLAKRRQAQQRTASGPRTPALALKPLAPQQAAHFAQCWNAVQAKYADDPRAAAIQAGQLLRALMFSLGYPMGELERLAAELAVHHPGVVASFRQAHLLTQAQSASATALRAALPHYQAVFAELLGTDSRVQPVQSARGEQLLAA